MAFKHKAFTDSRVTLIDEFQPLGDARRLDQVGAYCYFKITATNFNSETVDIEITLPDADDDTEDSRDAVKEDIAATWRGLIFVPRGAKVEINPSGSITGGKAFAGISV